MHKIKKKITSLINLVVNAPKGLAPHENYAGSLYITKNLFCVSQI